MTPSQIKAWKAMEEALEKSTQAISDWVATYASEFCGEETVRDSQSRIMANGGTLAYTATIQTENKVALTLAKDCKDE